MLRLSTPCGNPLLKSVTCLAVLSVSHTPLFPYNSTCARHFSVPRNSPLFQLLYRYAEGNHRLLMSIFEKSEGWFSIKPDTQNIDIKKAQVRNTYDALTMSSFSPYYNLLLQKYTNMRNAANIEKEKKEAQKVG